MTMLKPCKMNEIAEQMLGTQLQIIALQEIRWKGHGQIKKNTYSLYYSCSEQTTGHFGTGFVVRKEIEKNRCPLLQLMKKYVQLDLKENSIT
jgi:exonuclease III